MKICEDVFIRATGIHTTPVYLNGIHYLNSSSFFGRQNSIGRNTRPCFMPFWTDPFLSAGERGHCFTPIVVGHGTTTFYLIADKIKVCTGCLTIST